MTEPKEFQGVPRTELVRLVVSHRELRKQDEVKFAQMLKRWISERRDVLVWLRKYPATDAASHADAIEHGDHKGENGEGIVGEECTKCAGVVIPCPDCGVTWAHGFGCPRR